MIDVNDALKLVIEHTPVLQTETLPLMGTLHSVLAETIVARDDSPVFDSSRMDGYGVKVNDVRFASDETPVALDIAGVVRAGQVYDKLLKRGTAVKIFTGAMIPEGVEAVVIKENSQEIGGKVLVKSSVRPGENIRRRGAEFRKGDAALPPGLLITPPVIGFLAGLGYAEVRVYRKPAVAVIVTGDELIDPQDRLEYGKIRDVNTFTIQAALQEIGIGNFSSERVPDDPQKLLESVEQLLPSVDVLIVSGGVSVGDFDFVKGIFESVGIEKVFWRVAVKPGKPTFFGTKGKTLIFGLPGNPASVLVTFYLFVRPALLRMMGRKETQPTCLSAVVESGVHKEDMRTVHKEDMRTEYLRGKLQIHNGEASVGFHGGQHSHMLGSFANADCLVIFPKEETHIPKGRKVKAQLLPWFAL
jgi:molybdopterin molybdotransferase